MKICYVICYFPNLTLWELQTREFQEFHAKALAIALNLSGLVAFLHFLTDSNFIKLFFLC